jgi:hypothetical protein
LILGCTELEVFNRDNYGSTQLGEARQAVLQADRTELRLVAILRNWELEVGAKEDPKILNAI